MRINSKKPTSIKDKPDTRQRRLLLDILRNTRGHMDARQLYQRAIERDPHISLATVYRNLRLFKELELIYEMHLDDARCYYELRSSADHHHLVCKSCGKVIEFESPTVAQLVEEVQHNCDFDITRAMLYLEGYCRECKDKAKTS
jgi:Fur family ferric uptake transcriptional regulator